MYTLTKLSNGLRVMMIPLKQTKAVTVLILVRAGSRFENKEENGLAHFIEHMFFKGGKRYPNTQAISEAIDSVGGVFNAFTSKEDVGYWIKLVSTKLPLALDVLSDMLINAQFDEQEIQREKGVVLEEINLYEDDPITAVGALLKETIFGDSCLGWPIVGSRESVSSINRTGCLSYLKRLYLPQNMVICLAGNISPKSTLSLIKKYFPLKGSYLSLGAKTQKWFQKEARLSLKYKKTDQAHLMLGFPGLSLFHPALPTLSVLDALLAASTSSRLFLEIRERKGLAYAVHSSMEAYTDTGYWSVYIGTGLNKVRETLALTLKELKKIKEKPPSFKEIKKAQELIKGRSILEMEDSQFVASYFAEQALLRPRKIKTFAQFFREINEVTPRKVQMLAKKIFNQDRLNLAIVGPYKSKKILEDLLKV